MNLLRVFQSHSKFFYISLLLLGIVNSVLFSGILILINLKLSQKSLFSFFQYDWIIFVLLLLTSMVVSKVFQGYLIRLTNEITFDFEIAILNKIRFSSLLGFEKLGFQRIYTALEDTRALSQIPESLVNVVNAMIIILCGIGYLLWISPIGASCVLFVMVLLLTIYIVRNKSIEKNLNIMRDLQENFHRYVRDLLIGFKEIKMSSIRTERIYGEFILKNREKSKDINTNTASRYLDNELAGNYSWYLVLGTILFLMPTFLKLEIREITGFVITVLYLMGPVAVLVAVLPFYTRVKIALQRIAQLEKDIDLKGAHEVLTASVPSSPFDKITFDRVVFEYLQDDVETRFKVGPINLEITKGELIFLTGGNGSGKSTFIKLLTGLYRPTEGKIHFNGCEVSDAMICSYRDQISSIFTDNYLTTENYDQFNLTDSNENLRGHILFMYMDKVLKYENNKFNLNLSKGQTKRLALILALMEKKSILVLDEWAAEQDPDFRRYFYRVVLPSLLDAGKTIIAVTHDDNYFDCAHRIIKFDFGEIVSDIKFNEKTSVVTTIEHD